MLKTKNDQLDGTPPGSTSVHCSLSILSLVVCNNNISTNLVSFPSKERVLSRNIFSSPSKYGGSLVVMDEQQRVIANSNQSPSFSTCVVLSYSLAAMPQTEKKPRETETCNIYTIFVSASALFRLKYYVVKSFMPFKKQSKSKYRKPNTKKM